MPGPGLDEIDAGVDQARYGWLIIMFINVTFR